MPNLDPTPTEYFVKSYNTQIWNLIELWGLSHLAQVQTIPTYKVKQKVPPQDRSNPIYQKQLCL
jgi:hypothetical protein